MLLVAMQDLRCNSGGMKSRLDGNGADAVISCRVLISVLPPQSCKGVDGDTSCADLNWALEAPPSHVGGTEDYVGEGVQRRW